MRANFFDDYAEVRKHEPQPKQTDNDDLFVMEKPVLTHDDRPKENEDVFYTKEEIDNLFKDLIAKVENVGKVEPTGGEE